MRRLWFRLVRWAFRQLYGPLAWAYDGVAWVVSRGEWQRWGRAALPWILGERVLELGCGPGHLLAELAARGRTAMGLDLSPAMLGMARGRLRRRGLVCRLTLGRAQALPFADQAFDTVVVTFPAEFIGQAMTLAEISRVLAPGGRFVLVDEGRHLGRDLWSRVLNWALDVTSNRAMLDELLEDLSGKENEEESLFIVTHGLVRGARSVVRVVVARRRGGEARDGRGRLTPL